MNLEDKIIVALLGLLAVFYLASGIALYFHPMQTFDSLPSYYGEFNHHFVKDAGLAFTSSAILLFLAVFKRRERLIYSFSASLFVVLHGLFHVQMLLSGMVPKAYLGDELVQVIAPAMLLLGLVVVIYARQRHRDEPEQRGGDRR